MANTVIQLKYSSVTSQPPTLNTAEPAYSNVSGVLWIDDGTGVVPIGGKSYTNRVDAATSAFTANTIVKRDTSGNFSANVITATLYGNANSATVLETARNFSINGDDVDSSTISFDGSNDVVLQGNLKTTGVSAGTYGGTSNIAVFSVDSKGRLSYAANVSISTSLVVASDTGQDTIELATDTLNLIGGEGISTITDAGNNKITFDVDNTVVRSNTAFLNQTIDGNITISGNLTVTGNVTSVDVTTLSVEDSLIALARNNTTDAVDIGFYGHYNDGSTDRHAGLYRHAGDKQFYVFDNYDQEPAANTINPAHASFRLATLHTNLTSNTANAGTLYVANRIFGDTTNNTLILAPSTNYGPGVNDQYIIVDPTAPNHIHLRAGGTIDGSTADLYLGGENTGVQVSDSSDTTYIRANTHTWAFTNEGKFKLLNNNYIYDDASTIFVDSPQTTFSGNVTSNGSATISTNLFVPNLPNAPTGNLVFFDSANGRFSYASDNLLTPTSIANGSYSLSISGTDGLLTTNGAGLELANGAVIKDTAGDAVAFGQNAGTLNQGSQAVAIGDSAGYNNQGAYGVAIGYGAGNISQGQVAIAIGLNAGISNQGYNGIAIGGSAGSGQGQYSIAMGYDSGGQQGDNSIAIGNQAGKGNTTAIGANTVAIGAKAGFESAAAGSIILNASGNNLSSAAAGLYVNPVRYTATQDPTYDGIMFFNSNTKEIRYSYVISGGTF